MYGRETHVTFRNIAHMSVGRDQLLFLVEIILGPLVAVLSICVVAWFVAGNVEFPQIVVAFVVFAIMFPGSARLDMPPWRVVRHIFAEWIAIASLLLLVGYASGYLDDFERALLLTWCWAVPAGQLIAHFTLRLGAPAILALQGPPRRAVVAGMNEKGIELARGLDTDPYCRVTVAGLFDDRKEAERRYPSEYPLLGTVQELPAYVRENHVDYIYISLPMVSQPRVLDLLDALRDTTASVYFVPDVIVSDLFQGHMDTFSGLPVVAVRESPFIGLNAVLKRGSDIVFALLFLALTSPLLLGVALAVKLGSPGPVIFRQRRYGLDGGEIIVYKFRSMTVVEDGGAIEQAHKEDPRITPLGAFLRRTSIDELPQLFNVLQGRMSMVGPRPHAVAHNEMYRKLIKGYMLRHKVRPGITGWAQVNGYRGETETLEKMARRIDYDVDYLRNWSLRFDLRIIIKTLEVVLKRENAY